MTVKRRMIGITAYVSGLLGLLILIEWRAMRSLTVHVENIDVEMVGGTPIGR